MEIVAIQKNTRQSPRKVRLVANTVRKLPLEQALRQLAVVERRASVVITKLIRQALADAWHNHNLSVEEVELKNILVTPGPTYKRWRAVSRGRAHNIFKRTSHISVILEAKATSKKSVKKTAKKVTKTAAKPAKTTKDNQAKSGMIAQEQKAAPRKTAVQQKPTQRKVIKKAS